ncbi:MAG: hypothetical protein WC135_08870 [Bacteroidales bacterium]
MTYHQISTKNNFIPIPNNIIPTPKILVPTSYIFISNFSFKDSISTSCHDTTRIMP